jgi:hypothetical protein
MSEELQKATHYMKHTLTNRLCIRNSLLPEMFYSVTLCDCLTMPRTKLSTKLWQMAKLDTEQKAQLNLQTSLLVNQQIRIQEKEI